MLPLECLVRGNADIDTALVISENRSVYCHNQSAEQQGIRKDMSLSTAQALCPTLKILERCHKQEQRLLLNLADWCYRFTPAISLHPPRSLLLEIRSCLRLFHGLPSLLSRLYSGLRQQGLSPVISVAPTPAAASLFASADHKDWSRFCDPCSGESDQAAFLETLAELPLSTLPISKRQHQQMQRTGFKYLGDLFALNPTALGRRFGKHFNQLLAKIRGELHDPQAIQKPLQCFENEIHLLDSIDKQEQLLTVMETLYGIVIFSS